MNKDLESHLFEKCFYKSLIFYDSIQPLIRICRIINMGGAKKSKVFL
jgi:hypothetical protein